MKHLSKLFRFKRKLEVRASIAGFRELKVLIQDFDPAETRIEDGKTYNYPATIMVKIENWSNHNYSFRLKDAVWIREGSNLSGIGISTVELYIRMRREVNAFVAHRNSLKIRGA